LKRVLAQLTLATLLAFVVVLSLRVRGSESPMRGPRVLRVLLPAWRFFDEPGPQLRLYCRTGSSSAALGDFHEVLLPTPSRHGLLLAARGNLRLAYHTLLERLISDLSALEAKDADPAELVSYGLVVNLVRQHLPAAVGDRGEPYFQFKLSLHNAPEACEEEDILLSGLHPV
jgi:hypothetical protein